MDRVEEIEALIARVAMGDREAFRTLYARSSAKLYGVALRVSGEPALAEAALQDVFVNVWDRAGQYRANGYSPTTWLITLTRNAAIDRLRSARAAGEAAPVSEAELVADTGRGPDASAIAGDAARALDLCLRELPPDRAAMLRAAYLRGAGYTDIARATETRPDRVRTWLRRSLMQLRECLSR